MRLNSGSCRAFFVFSLSIALCLSPSIGRCQSFDIFGDSNGDGWCNWADIDELVQYFRGGEPIKCAEAADMDGNGNINAIDVIYLNAYFRGGPPPVNYCPYIVFPQWTNDPNQTAQVELQAIPDGDPGTATFRVYLRASTQISVLSLSYQFNPAAIANFSATSMLPGRNVVLFSNIRPFTPPNSLISIGFDTYIDGGSGNFPTLTAIFDLVITAVPGAPNTAMTIVENDPIFGPPLCYFGPPYSIADNSIVLTGSSVVPGDANGDGIANGLDVVYMVNYFTYGTPGLKGRFFDIVPIDWNY